MAQTYTALDICTDAAIEIGIIAPGEDLPGEQAQWIFRKQNYLLDWWAAQKIYVYATNFQVFTLIPNHAPHTIGPGGDFNVPQRPVRIESAALLLNGSTTEVDCEITVRDNQWWAAQQTKSITSTVPTDLYYSAAWALGQCNFWPVPSVGRDVRLQLWQLLSQYDNITDPISGPGTSDGTLPPAYRSAMMLTLAESICGGFEREIPAATALAAIQARKAVFGNNNTSPRIATQDYGMPKSGRKGYFNYGFGGPPGLGPR